MSFRNRFNSFVNYVYLIYREILFDSYQYRIPLNVPLVCMRLLAQIFLRDPRAKHSQVSAVGLNI